MGGPRRKTSSQAAPTATASTDRDLGLFPEPARKPKPPRQTGRGHGQAPTAEQQGVIDAVAAELNVIVQARSGTGKTKTLVEATAACPDRKALCLVYNRTTALDGRRRFGRHVQVRTLHSVAHADTSYWQKDRLRMPRQNSRMVADLLKIPREPLVITEGSFGMPIEVRLRRHHIGRIVIEALRRFCYSAEPEPRWWHVPKQTGFTLHAHRYMADQVLPHLQRAWDDVQDPRGNLRYDHDYYLKLWAAEDPQLPASLVLLDEAQDSNRLTSQLIAAQRNAQTVIVGDDCQQIYEWRGATNAMREFPQHHTKFLTQSFRFGQPIADAGNVFLTLIGAHPLVIGHPDLNSRIVEHIDTPDAILCRTNGGAMGQVMQLLDDGQPVHLQGGTDDIRKLAEAALELQAGHGTNNPDLCAFRSWFELVEYAEYDPSGQDLRAFVRLVDSYGADTIIDACDRMAQPASPRRLAPGTVVVSTMHRAKGLEWPRVKIGPDVAPPRVDFDTGVPQQPDPAECMLNYVAATRARHELDPGSLRSWLVPGSPPSGPPPDLREGPAPVTEGNGRHLT